AGRDDRIAGGCAAIAGQGVAKWAGYSADSSRLQRRGHRAVGCGGEEIAPAGLSIARRGQTISKIALRVGSVRRFARADVSSRPRIEGSRLSRYEIRLGTAGEQRRGLR